MPEMQNENIANALFDTMNAPRGWHTMTYLEKVKYEKLAQDLIANLNHEYVTLEVTGYPLLDNESADE